MRYIDNGCAQSLMELGNLNTHLHTKLGIQVGKRLVHKEYLRAADNCTTHGNTLSLTTGKSLRLTVKKRCQVKNLGSFLNHLVDFILRNLSQFKSESHVIINRHMRIQSIVLEYHCNIPVLRLHIIYNSVANL